MKEAFDQYSTLLALKGYSTNTIETYTALFKRYLYFLKKINSKPKDVSQEIIKKYMEHLVLDNHISNSLQNQTINAIKFYYEKVLHRTKTNYYLERPLKKTNYLKYFLKRKLSLFLTILQIVNTVVF